jgi:hypothetical protein
MFDQIGKKIKALAIVIFVAGIIISVYVGVLLAETYAEESIALAIALCLISFAIGVIGSWLSVLLLFGFGELVDQSMETNQRLEENHEALEEIIELLKEQNGHTAHTVNRPRMTPPPPAVLVRNTRESPEPARAITRDIDSAQLPLRRTGEQENMSQTPENKNMNGSDDLYIPRT